MAAALAVAFAALWLSAGAPAWARAFYAAPEPGLPAVPGSLAGAVTYTLYLPLVSNGPAVASSFAFETNNPVVDGILLARTMALGAGSSRLGSARLSWRDVEPEEGGPYQWTALAGFEQEVRALRSVGVASRPIVMDSPRWATVAPTSCSAIRADKLGRFAAFMAALVARYSTDEFGIHEWELGNEPDVDPSLMLSADPVFGCWGNIADPYYGGQAYGEMLKAAGPAIRAADPSARIWLGGLLLDKPLTTDPALGHPELFFQGILEAGAAPWLDVVAYHAHNSFAITSARVDYDTGPFGRPWDPLGGGTIGKATYLSGIMAQYGISKPLAMNEATLRCPTNRTGCPSTITPTLPIDLYLDAGADYLVRKFVRGLSWGLSSISWYTLEYPGWENSSLLNADGTPRPAYNAYQYMIARVDKSASLGPVTYSGELEAYAFRRTSGLTHVVWARTDITTSLVLSPSSFIAASDRFGTPVEVLASGDALTVPVTFSPVYLTLRP